ncbi:MAG: ATP-binding protein [Candidatus Methanoperedens sp.]|nr:ATP-binding protein [Candidatus Methanoperedens sp.]
MSKNPFDEDRLYGARSALVRTTPDKQGRFEFELWSQYTRLGLDSLQIGDLVAVENYTPPEKDLKIYSVLTLTQVYPIHFASQGTDAYPGHVFESMRSIKEDWEKQSDRPLHPTTTIISHAVSTGWQFIYDPKNESLPILDDEKNLPMVGAEVRPLSMKMVDGIINLGMEDQPKSPFTHKKFAEINIKLNKEALLTTHFGIFGFTGVGKSNLVSSMVTALSSVDVKEKSNVVIIDPNDEYLGLLIDRFVNTPEEMRYIHVGTDSLPLPIIKNLGENSTEIPPEIVDLLLRQMKLPARLKGDPDLQKYMRKALAIALKRTKIALPATTLSVWIKDEMRAQLEKGTGAAVKDVLRDLEQDWTEPFLQSPITFDSIQKALDRLGNVFSVIEDRLKDESKKSTAKGVIARTRNSLLRLQKNLNEILPSAIIPTKILLETLNNKSACQTLIITARRDSDLKRFCTVLGNELYESRRREGKLEPHTLFLFDEADLFIPLDSGDEETNEVKELCVTLARRGRKFGLGIGISTQRAALLDTEVMGNLHTYLVSKLPRSTDRQRVAEAFGIGEEQLSPTFTFRPGNWLIISHDATGLKGVPIPTVADDANERILQAAKGKSK